MRSNSSSLRKGRLVAFALEGSWRHSRVAPLELSSADLDEVTPLLYGSGAAGLGWRRVRESKLNDTDSAALLQQAYRLLALQAAIHEQKIEKVFRLLRAADVEPILIKGWAAAQLYPDNALRPYGDIDLVVLPGQHQRAVEVLSSPEANDCWVDLHERLAELDDRPLDLVFARSQIAKLNDSEVRVLSYEDQLALLSIHLLKHGAWRPLWLCDVSAAVESLTPDFAWEICLGTNPRRARWITAAIGLAHRLLHADLSAVPMASEANDIPTWLYESVLKQWATPFAINQPPMSHPTPMGNYLKRPLGIVTALRERWPNPILATISINGQFNDFPRLPYQVGNCAVRLGQFLVQLPGRFRAEP